MHYNHFYFSFLNKDISASTDNIMMKHLHLFLSFIMEGILSQIVRLGFHFYCMLDTGTFSGFILLSSVYFSKRAF